MFKTNKSITKSGVVEFRVEDTDPFVDQLLHNQNGPAVISEDGKHFQYYYKGLLHREDGPAVDFPNHKQYWIHGKLHNQNGPAIIHNFKIEKYFYHGLECSKEVHAILTRRV